MHNAGERRRDQRIRYCWPTWFGYEENGEFQQGQMIDLSRHGACFSVNGPGSPEIGHHILTRFSYPLNGSYDFQMGTYYQWSEVIRVDKTATGQTRIAVKLSQPLEQDPAQSAEPEYALQTA